MSKLRIWAAALVALVGAIGACGGKVVVDGGSGSGAGGVGGIGGGLTGGGTINVGGAGGASCFNAPDPATLTFCSGGVGSGGGNLQCENDFCDAEGNIWSAVCTATACQCKLNTVVLCDCALNGPGNFCAGTPSCCPIPKI